MHWVVGVPEVRWAAIPTAVTKRVQIIGDEDLWRPGAEARALSELHPDRLSVRFRAKASGDRPELPRRYTLTHSDRTGDLFLSIGPDYDIGQISGIYTRLMRDEVLAELVNDQGKTSLHVYVHVSGGFVFGLPAWRNDILHYHMPMVLAALRYGDRELFAAHPELDETEIFVHFSSSHNRYNKVEDWHQIKKYR